MAQAQAAEPPTGSFASVHSLSASSSGLPGRRSFGSSASTEAPMSPGARRATAALARALKSESSAIREAVAKLEKHDRAIRLEIDRLPTQYTLSKIKQKVTSIKSECETIEVDAMRQMEALKRSVATVSETAEQMTQRAACQDLEECLLRGAEAYKAAARQFEKAVAERARHLQDAAQAFAGGRAERANGRSDEGRQQLTEAEQLRQLQVEAADQADVDMHLYLAEEQAQGVGRVHRNVQQVQRIMLDLRQATQAQGGLVDNIEHNMRNTVEQTEGATEQLVQAGQRQQRRSRLLYIVLALAVMIAITVIFAAIKKSNEPTPPPPPNRVRPADLRVRGSGRLRPLAF